MVAAVERYMKIDHDAEIRMLEKRVEEMIRVLSPVKGLKAEVMVPKIANQVPHLTVSWDASEKRMTAQEVVKKMREGDPPIAISGSGPGKVTVSVWMMRANEHRTTANRLRQIMSA
jgi:L-seryl-tRNA(Ser) seleniumtransferase